MQRCNCVNFLRVNSSSLYKVCIIKFILSQGRYNLILFRGAKVSKIETRVGNSKYNIGGVVVQAASVIIHPKFVPGENNYDAALIKVSFYHRVSL